ncbi:Trypsin-1 [Orchesella cincta]|uniref:Trypsin-1 n=1 Tax=Orchesella cincta TaxID=48709 RepID=A0A1D2MA78_ORCCI|nr:Trypsin-1 [Orchesella cincta]
MKHFVFVFILCAGSSHQFQELPQIKENEDKFIIGGSPSTEGELPYQILLQNQGRYVCGGSFVNVTGVHFVLTAAHCVNSRYPTRYTVIAGEHDRTHVSGHEQKRAVTKIFVHEKYSSRTIQNDIALLVLDEPFEVNEFVSPIPLPTQGQKTKGEVMVSGWGYTSPMRRFGSTSKVLKKVTISVIDNLACKAFYGVHFIYVSNSMLCVGKLRGFSSSCFGDSGGPLRSVEGGYVAGIVSWGTICAFPLQPGVYTEVSRYVNWIELKASSVGLPE